ncbi:hypothetical protein [Bosea beijingensis]|uniref:hypothetical protein n=1 Tax=Bosea beijingensis TaxID=3068632 RepID=UPI00274197EE|nr:hypothetical protein [Bosea sp. REN20]
MTFRFIVRMLPAPIRVKMAPTSRPSARARLMLTAIAIIYSLGASAHASAGAKPLRVSVGTALSAQPQVTYADLLRQVIPNLSLAGEVATGRLSAPLRAIDRRSPPIETLDHVEIREISALTFKAVGKPRLAVLANISRSNDAEQRTLLAVFDISRPPRLLDAVDVGMDRSTAFDDHPLVQIGPQDIAVVTSSRHSNSNQSYALNSLIFMQDGALALVDTFLVFGERGCGFTQRQSISIKRRPDSQSGRYHDLDVTITDRRRAVRESCDVSPPKGPAVQTTHAIYRWTAAEKRYLPQSDALKRLADRTAERF